MKLEKMETSGTTASCQKALKSFTHITSQQHINTGGETDDGEFQVHIVTEKELEPI